MNIQKEINKAIDTLTAQANDYPEIQATDTEAYKVAENLKLCIGKLDAELITKELADTMVIACALLNEAAHNEAGQAPLHIEAEDTLEASTAKELRGALDKYYGSLSAKAKEAKEAKEHSELLQLTSEAINIKAQKSLEGSRLVLSLLAAHLSDRLPSVSVSDTVLLCQSLNSFATLAKEVGAAVVNRDSNTTLVCTTVDGEKYESPEPVQACIDAIRIGKPIVTMTVRVDCSKPKDSEGYQKGVHTQYSYSVAFPAIGCGSQALKGLMLRAVSGLARS